MKNYLYLMFLLTFTLNADLIIETKNILSSTKESIFNAIETEDKTSELKKKRFDEIWSEVFPKLKKGSLLQKNMISAPESDLFATDKVDIQEDINDILNDIYSTLVSDNLFEYKVEIKEYEKKIKKLKNEIQISYEEKILAPQKSSLLTTKADYDEKIKNLKIKIILFEDKIKLVRENLSNNFKKIGVEISDKQLDTILTRVDGNDFVQLYLIADVLKQITKQLLELMNANNEELSIAKNYYGMHLVSMQLVVFVQEKYRDKLFNNYLIELNKMQKKNTEILHETKYSLKQENDPQRKDQYENNLKAQEFNLKVIKLYKDHLNISLKSIAKIIIESKKQVLLSRNTFLTVSSSSQLLTMINKSMSEYNKIMQIKMPEIQIFKNTAIKEKYLELSKIMQDSSLM